MHRSHCNDLVSSPTKLPQLQQEGKLQKDCVDAALDGSRDNAWDGDGAEPAFEQAFLTFWTFDPEE